MKNVNSTPNEQIIFSAVKSMIGENVVSAERMATGDQNFVYVVTTSTAEYVLRMTEACYKYKFHAAIEWQKILLPLGVPLAEFIASDLDAKYSPYPALLMRRLPGDDLINVYKHLTNSDKKKLANEMINIQALCERLPEGPGFGILHSYVDSSVEKTWYGFLTKRLELCKENLIQQAIFDPHLVTQVLKLSKDMEENFRIVRPMPFLWDASERNVLVHKGKITGIVDVDEICFGDPLLVIALTSTCLELEGFDTLYTDYWSAGLHLNTSAQNRLAFYKLFYAIAFMRKHSMQTANNKKLIFDIKRLLSIFHNSLERLNK
ncbi:MAG: aminoglycoside phosphotransferase family protein [Tatlockia sp.]|nr:aminoglycoside phosphotransferase family protein [Tatlockia sp.]